MHQHSVHEVGALAKRLRLAVILTGLVLLGEVVGGVLANSLALLSDAGHVFADVAALSLSWYGVKQLAKPADARMTCGYHRTGVLIAVINAVTLIIVSVVIFYQAALRLREPQEVAGMLMLGVAVVGFLANFIIVLYLYRPQRRSINVRSAFLHALGDALASVGVIAAGIIIYFTAWFWVDPIISIFIGLIIAVAAWRIIREGMDIFLEASPRHLNVEKLAAAMCRVAGVKGVHDVHLWTISPQMHAFSCHVVVDDVPVSESKEVLDRVNWLLAEKFDIEHSTIQVETESCQPEAYLYCLLSPQEKERTGD